jgi:hypothetical protein
MMGRNTKKLTKRQFGVLDDLFDGDMDEKAVLERHNVNRRVYCRWLVDEVFGKELRLRIESARRSSEIIIAKAGPKAAEKLVLLTDSEKNQETARKACLDIISRGQVKERKRQVKKKADVDKKVAEIAGPVAAKILEVLAEEDAL